METGVELIAKERLRQIQKECWSDAHDSEHDNDELALAAVCYALPKLEREQIFEANNIEPPNLWPWEMQWWKPTPNDRVRELVKAGALIAAEIDRLNNEIK